MDLPPGYKLTKVGSSNAGIIVRMIGSVIFLIVLLVVFMISKVNSEQQLKLRQMELQNEQQASKAQVIMDTISVEPVSMSVGNDVVTTSPAPASVQVKSQKWKQFLDTGITYGTTLWTLRESTTPEASMENCVKKCGQQDNCELVMTDNSHSKCWGKADVTNKPRGLMNGRIIYEKSEDGMLPPWDGGTQWADHPWNQTLSPAPQTKWKVHTNKDATMGTRDVFHLTRNSTPGANLKNCLEKCDKRSECGAVVTDNSKSLCWGKTNITNTSSTGNRIIYEKSEDGVLEPWNTQAPAPSSTPAPSPTQTSNISTNGRCGPPFNNTICPGKECCSYSNWCAGTQGTKSAWCYSSTNKGRDDGKYDGRAN